MPVGEVGVFSGGRMESMTEQLSGQWQVLAGHDGLAGSGVPYIVKPQRAEPFIRAFTLSPGHQRAIHDGLRHFLRSDHLPQRRGRRTRARRPSVHALRKDVRAAGSERKRKTKAMNTMLFNPVEQKQGPTTARERTFGFLQRGGRREAVPIQHWMEAWFQAIPDNRRKKFGERTNVRTFRAIFGGYV